MDKRRILFAIATTTVLGVATALAVPDDWLIYFFWGVGIAALVFGSLAAASAQEGKREPNSGAAARIVLWLAVGTDRPMAQMADTEALIYFCGSLAYLAGLTLGRMEQSMSNMALKADWPVRGTVHYLIYGRPSA